MNDPAVSVHTITDGAIVERAVGGGIDGSDRRL
jgi:hypothetical protein